MSQKKQENTGSNSMPQKCFSQKKLKQYNDFSTDDYRSNDPLAFSLGHKNNSISNYAKQGSSSKIKNPGESSRGILSSNREKSPSRYTPYQDQSARRTFSRQQQASNREYDNEDGSRSRSRSNNNDR